MPVNEAEADDGAIHRFWAFILLRRAAGQPADVENVVALLLLIIIFEAVKDTIPEHP